MPPKGTDTNGPDHRSATRTRLSDEERARILDLHGEGVARNEIARLVGRGPGTVTRVVQAEGLSFERAPEVAAATAAKTMDNAAKRARLEELLLDDALRLREQLWEPALVYNFGGKDNSYEERTLPQPDFGGQNAIMRTVGTAIDKAVRLAEVGRGTQDAGPVVSLLGALVDGLRDEYREDDTPDA